MKIGTTVEITSKNDFEIIKRMGFSCFDAQGLVNPEGYLYTLSDAEFEKTVRDTKETVDALGLEASQLHGPWRWPAEDDTEEKRAHWLTLCARAIRACELLGCKHFVIHPLMPFGSEERDAAFAREINRDFFKKLCVLGEAHGVVICVENMPFAEQSLARVAPLLDFVKEIDSPWLRICLDTGHCSRLGGSPAEAVRLLGKEYLAVMHVHDNDGKADRHWEPGLGVIYWRDFMAALVEIGFEGTLSMEIAYRYSIGVERDAYFARIAEVARGLTAYAE